MSLSEIRAEARKSLTGKWGKAAVLTLVYVLITWVISFVLGFVPVVGSLISFIIDLPITYGFLVVMIKLKRGEEVGYTDFLSLGFSEFIKVWAVFGNILLKMIIPIVLMVVFLMMMIFGGAGTALGVGFESSTATAGFGALATIGLIGYVASTIWATVKGLLYSLSYYILYDNNTQTGKWIVEESERLMRGNRWKFFLLPITFIGWMILAVFTLGIGYLWLTPYMMVALVCFYEALAGNRTHVEAEIVTETPSVEPVVEEPAEENDNPIINTDEENNNEDL